MTEILLWPDKDPDEILDYQMDWSSRLVGDIISVSTWVLPVGSTLNKVAESKTTTSTTIWLSGGTLGERYELLNRIDTAAGRKMDQTVSLIISSK